MRNAAPTAEDMQLGPTLQPPPPSPPGAVRAAAFRDAGSPPGRGRGKNTTWLWLKKTVPKWHPSKWKHGPKPA